jgi:hypothetical protein
MDAIRGLFFRKLQNSVRTRVGETMQAELSILGLHWVTL